MIMAQMRILNFIMQFKFLKIIKVLILYLEKYLKFYQVLHHLFLQLFLLIHLNLLFLASLIFINSAFSIFEKKFINNLNFNFSYLNFKNKKEIIKLYN